MLLLYTPRPIPKSTVVLLYPDIGPDQCVPPHSTPVNFGNLNRTIWDGTRVIRSCDNNITDLPRERNLLRSSPRLVGGMPGMKRPLVEEGTNDSRVQDMEQGELRMHHMRTRAATRGLVDSLVARPRVVSNERPTPRTRIVYEYGKVIS